MATIKFLSADDEGYTVEFPVKSGETFTTIQKRIPPITLITSTTRIDMEGQFERRAWIINPDESEEQTTRVKGWKINNEKEEIEAQLGFREMTSRDYSVKVLSAVVRKLEPCIVDITPYLDELLGVLNTKHLRVRGDYSKIITSVKLYGCLIQRAAITVPVKTPKGNTL